MRDKLNKYRIRERLEHAFTIASGIPALAAVVALITIIVVAVVYARHFFLFYGNSAKQNLCLNANVFRPDMRYFWYQPVSYQLFPAQIVGTQAVFNVLMGERYKMATKETKAVLRGEYGQTVKPMNTRLCKV